MTRIGVLGPLTVDGDGVRLAPREQVVLAALTVRRGEVVSAHTLADAWWGEELPSTWKKALQGCVVQLRKVLGPGAIETRAHGYCLLVPADEVDAGRFERQLDQARELLALNDTDRAAYVLGEALGLWRGRALVDLDGWEPGRVEATRLDELRLEAEELRVEATLQAGRFREVLAHAQALVDEEPLREHRWELLALAQYQAGRQGDALRTLHRARRVLTEELGLDPGPGLVALEDAILRQDPALVATQLPDPSPVCPYLGLVPYGVDDVDRFFGRERDVSECVQRLADRGVLAVVGPSGSGKSSMVRAGIAATLRRDGQEVTVITPGARPVDSLVAHHGTLVVDQCEEAVTLCTDRDEQAAFFEALVEHASRAPLVVALRADRLAAVSSHAGFARIVERGLYLLQAMDETDLRAAIEAPARQAGLLLEPGLVDLLVRDVEGEPGALPLLSHALRQTWQRREGRTLSVAGYRASGGIRGAVAQSAELLYEQVPPEQRPIMRDLLLRLVAPSPEGEPVRSRVPRRLVGTDALHEQIIEQLISARLVTSDEGVVELAHEALARAWPRLRSWLDDDVDGQRIWRHVSTAASAWDAMDRPDSELYRGVRLDQAMEWRTRAAPDLNPVEQTFLDASQNERDDERRREADQLRRTARANRRLRVQLVALCVALVIALVVGVVAVRQRDEAASERRIATTRELTAASSASLDVDPERSILLALAAVDRSRSQGGAASTEAEQALHDAVTASRATLHVPGVGGAVAWSPDGTRFAAAGPRGSVAIHDATTGERIQELAGDDERVNGITFSQDGELLGATSENGYARVWELRTGDELHALTSPRILDALAPAFSPDGSLFAAAWWNEGLVQVMDVSTGRIVQSVDAVYLPRTAAFDQDGRRMLVASLSGGGVILDVASGRTIVDLDGGEVRAAAWSPDGLSVATADADGDIRVLDASTGQARYTIAAHPTRVNDVAWSRDGTRIVTAGDDGTAQVWRVGDNRGRHLFTLSAQDTRAGIITAAFSPDGSQVLTGDIENRAAIVWQAGWGGTAEVATLPAVDATENFVAFSGDGRSLVTGNAGGGVTVWDAETLTITRTLGPRPPEVDALPGGDFVDPPAASKWVVNALDISPDGRLVAVASADYSVVPGASRFRIWDIESGQEVMRVVPRGSVDDVAWSPDGEVLAVSTSAFALDDSGDIISAKGWLSVFDRSGHEMAARPDEAEGVHIQTIGFTPDGTRVIGSRSPMATFDPDFGEVVAWDWQRDEIDGRIETGGVGAALSPRGDLLVSTPENYLGGSQIAEVWDWRTGDHLRTIVGNSGSVIRSAFSPDGARLATSGKDGTVRIWDPYTGEAQLTLRGHRGPVTSLVFSPDGSRLASASQDGTVRVWALRVDELVRIADQGLTRTLTDDECRRYLHVERCPEP